MLQFLKANIKKSQLLIEFTLFFPAMNLLSSPPGLKDLEDGLGHLVLLMNERGCLPALDGLQIFHLFDPSGTGFMTFAIQFAPKLHNFCFSIFFVVTLENLTLWYCQDNQK
jgi:hypothetical protein